MKITVVKTNLYKVPLLRPAEDARHGTMHQVELILVHLATDDGLTGCGYAYTIGSGGSAVKALIDDYLAAGLVGQDPLFVEKIWEDAWWKIHWVGRGGLASFALAAVDIALWDLAAKRAGLPLYQYLGGHRRSIPAYGSGVDLHLSEEDLLAQVEGFLEEGFRWVKIKVGREDFQEDLRRVRLVRDLIGPDIGLMVDVNMHWTAAQAITRGRALQEYDVLWLEEPLVPDDIQGHRQVAQALDMAVAVGENLHTKYEFQHYLQADAVDVVQLDVVTVGGITEWLKVAALAEVHNLPITTHYAEEIQVHLLTATPASWMAERHAYRLDHVLENPITIKDGRISPPDVPGHGMVFNEEKLGKYLVR
ncbi:MAG: mandelate racemase/muconate lactonizing enzyme family protein [Limnochordia bacterium]